MIFLARVYPLFSSSEGNCTYIGSSKCGILIDAGVSCKKIVTALSDNGIEPSAVNGIFVTHEHTDHIKGIKTLSSHFNIPVYAQGLNAQYLCDNGHIAKNTDCNVIENEIVVGGFSVKAFTTPHDTRQSCGYKILTPDGKSVCVCTDLGEVTDTVHENLMHSDLVLLEANYDYNMLRNGPYPFLLKKRIMSSNGHLDNRDSAGELLRLVEGGTARLIIGHLSRHNNLPSLAENTITSLMPDLKRNIDYILMTAPVETGGEVMIV